MMGMYDTIEAMRLCPWCEDVYLFDCKTKDLGRYMYTYRALPVCWFNGELDRDFKIKFKVFQRYPYDKEPKVWKNQAERREAMAKVMKEFTDLEFVNVIAECNHCSSLFDGRIKIEDGMLISPVLIPKETLKIIKEIRKMTKYDNQHKEGR